MYVIREVMHCQPGKVTPLVTKFKALNKALGKLGYTWPMRILTDTSGERYWTMVAEMEVKSLDEYLQMPKKTMSDPGVQKAMKDYHEFVDHGRREIFTIEG